MLLSALVHASGAPYLQPDESSWILMFDRRFGVGKADTLIGESNTHDFSRGSSDHLE
jgi:hypothetical protein